MPETKKSKKSLLRGSANYVAQVVTIEIGEEEYSFSLRELSAKAQIEIEEWAETAAADLGVTLEVFTDNDAFTKWMSAHDRDKHEASGLSMAMRLPELLEDKWDIALLDALSGWNLADELTPENIKRLPRTAKRPLFEALSVGSAIGVGAEQFFRGRA